MATTNIQLRPATSLGDPPTNQPAICIPAEEYEQLAFDPNIPELTNETSYIEASRTLIVIIDTELPLRPIVPIQASTKYRPTITAYPSKKPERPTLGTRTETRWQTVTFYTKKKLLHVLDVTTKEHKKKVAAWTRFTLPPPENLGGGRVDKLMFKFIDVRGKGAVKEVVVDLRDTSQEAVDKIVNSIEEEIAQERLKLRNEYIGRVTGGRMDSQGSIRSRR
ncbi:hypothetical protein BJ508DRAFT_410971 [Ascobolus immersus RN42]|uniref:Uncharacterized protein n=1 Tax=Ascobolus immersus RN42 TaxID=1160509 RepID=A0A3N4IM64_ASCIM|nr:hypothetical protein BJ508DRAFT_410971 [Ascobolus immersus RN42]